MPAIVCRIPALTSATGCTKGGGIRAIKAIPLVNINMTTLNAAPATYMNPTTLAFNAVALPLNAGATWTALSFDGRAYPSRIAEMDDNILKANIDIGALRFKGVYDTADKLAMWACCEWVVVTLFEDGTRMVDGLEYDNITDRFVPAGLTKFGGLALKSHKDTSATGENEEVANMTFNIKGITSHVGYRSLQPFATI